MIPEFKNYQKTAVTPMYQMTQNLRKEFLQQWSNTNCNENELAALEAQWGKLSANDMNTILAHTPETERAGSSGDVVDDGTWVCRGAKGETYTIGLEYQKASYQPV